MLSTGGNRIVPNNLHPILYGDTVVGGVDLSMGYWAGNSELSLILCKKYS